MNITCKQKLTGSGMEAAGVEELQIEMDINVTKKHQDIASFPGVRSNVQAPTSGKLLIHWDQGVIRETLFAAQAHI